MNKDKQQIWVDLETKTSLKQMASKQNKTMMKLLKDFACPIKNKKGQMPPALFFLFIVVALVIFAVATILFVTVSNDLNEEFQQDDDLTPESKQVYNDLNEGYPSWLDNGFLFMFIGIWIVLLVASFTMPEHPVFFIIMLIIMILTMYIGGVLSNLYMEISGEADLSSASNSLNNISFIIGHYVEFILYILGSMGLVLFARNKLR